MEMAFQPASAQPLVNLQESFVDNSNFVVCTVNSGFVNTGKPRHFGYESYIAVPKFMLPRGTFNACRS